MSMKQNENKALLKRIERYNNRVLEMLKTHNCLYLTFNFTDETLKNINQQNRLRTIKRFLNQQTIEYVLNLDYGARFGREHYHAIVIPRYKGIVYIKSYFLGNLKVIKIGKSKRYKNNDSIEKQADYFTNHAFKETTNNGQLIIYSRPKRELNHKHDKKLNKMINRTIEESNEKRQQKAYNSNKKDLEEIMQDFIDFNKEFENNLSNEERDFYNKIFKSKIYKEPIKS